MYNAKVTLVRTLLVFDADTKIENGTNQTAWMMALKQMQDTGLMDSISIGVSLKENRRAVLYSLYAIGAYGCLDLPPLDVKGKLSFSARLVCISEKMDVNITKMYLSNLSMTFIGKEMDFSGIEKLPLQKRTRSLFDDVLDTKLKRPKRSGRKTERARMLCLDGGGIKGLVLTRYVLYFFEVRLIK